MTSREGPIGLATFHLPQEPVQPMVARLRQWWVDGITDLILRAVRGENLLSRPRWPGPLQNDPAYAQVVDDILEPEREFELKLERWLSERTKK